MMRAGFAVGLLSVLAGCPVDAPGDGPDATPVSDAEAAGASLVVTLFADIDTGMTQAADPPHEATLNRLTGVWLQLDDVRIIGDAAPGNTGLAGVELDWQADPVECLRFVQVLPGIYSRLLASVVAYRIQGSLEDGGDEYQFTIEDTPPTRISLIVDTDDVIVDVERDGHLMLEFRADRVTDAIDWDAHVPDADNHVLVDASSPSIADIRDRMREAFQPDDELPTPTCVPDS